MGTKLGAVVGMIDNAGVGDRLFRGRGLGVGWAWTDRATFFSVLRRDETEIIIALPRLSGNLENGPVMGTIDQETMVMMQFD